MFKLLFNSIYLTLIISKAVFAVDLVNISVTGRVLASPCIVNSGSGDLLIDLGQNIQANTLENPGSGSPLVSQNLKLTNCPVGTTNVTVKFTGTADSVSTNMYKNTGAGAATSLAIELSNGGDGSLLSNNTSITQPVQADKTVTFKLNARAYTAQGSVMPGTINAIVVADFTYQ